MPKAFYRRFKSDGDYSEIYYIDDKGNFVDQEIATRCVIRECKNSGELLMETWGITENG